jgi:SNF2 family DNA or RNA helicase
MLRKVCNHPALLTAGPAGPGRGARRTAGSGGRGGRSGPEFDFGDDDFDGGELAGAASGGGDDPALLAASGKMVVVAEILRLWHAEGHRALLFCQGRQMLDLVERHVSGQGYTYLRMDGTTPVRDRQSLVDAFNSNPRWFVFLLTTKVGGVGVNLIGANRVLIYDPDWNPSTDLQARERAWRLGQRRHVTIYRLITTGTIEEKFTTARSSRRC